MTWKTENVPADVDNDKIEIQIKQKFKSHYTEHRRDIPHLGVASHLETHWVREYLRVPEQTRQKQSIFKKNDHRR